VESTDEALVERARQGDLQALQQLVERYQGKVYAMAMGMVRNRDDAMDVTQEAFLHVHRSLRGFRFSSKFSTWLYRIVTNVCFDHFRRTARSPKTISPPERDEGEGPPLDWPDREGERPDAAVQRAELREALEWAFTSLSPPHRAVVVLREMEGLSYEEIAKVVGCSVGTVMSRLHYARKQLQALLAPYRPSG
jgi:RNA polymerase sigma-70 factor, ECF subfamily